MDKTFSVLRQDAVPTDEDTVGAIAAQLSILAWRAYRLKAGDVGDAILAAADVAMRTAWRRSLS